MQLLGWQSVIATLCVALAVLVALRRVIMIWSGRSGGGCSTSGCAGCEVNETPVPINSPSAEFVALESLITGDEAGV